MNDSHTRKCPGEELLEMAYNIEHINALRNLDICIYLYILRQRRIINTVGSNVPSHFQKLNKPLRFLPKG